MARRQHNGNGDGRRGGSGQRNGKGTTAMATEGATGMTATAMDGVLAPWRQGTAQRLLSGDGRQGTARAQQHGRHDGDSLVMDSGALRQWTAQGQLDGEGRRIGDMTTMDDEDGASTTAMSTRPTMEATKANTAARH
jgi:hypothetical protein